MGPQERPRHLHLRDALRAQCGNAQHFRETCPVVCPADVVCFKGSAGKPISGNNCGTPLCSNVCAEYDLDGLGPVIGPADVFTMKTLVGKPVGPKCAVCPLP
jgi:hypothetical protein